jgi:protein TonB
MSTVLEVHDTETEKASRPEVRSINSPAARIVQPFLFSSVLLEVDSLGKRRRRWAAISSVAFQSLILGTLLIIPLMFTEALPDQQLLTFLVAPPPPPPAPAAVVPEQVVHRLESDLMDGRRRTPGRIPQKVQMIRKEEVHPPMNSGGGVVGGVPGGSPGGQLGGVIGGIISATSSTAAVPKLAVPERPERVRISQGVTKGGLLLKVEPKYPPIARGARAQGQVVLSAIISKTGEIEDLALLSGHPLLVPAAIEAVKQWRYRPYLLNGGAVEVVTTITVTFLLLQ